MSLPALSQHLKPASALSVAERKRYAGHLAIPELGEAGQLRLKGARVACVGAGGLGSPCLLYLAAAGIGTLGIIEDDRVDESNLQRQVLYGQSDVGHSKGQRARATLCASNPHIEVRLHEERLVRNNALRLLGGYDVVIDCTDNFTTRYLINDACVLLEKPCVWGSVYRFEGQVSVFWPPHGPCYRCLHPQPPPPEHAPSCAEGGVLGVVCAQIGSIQAAEAIKLVTGLGTPLVGRLLLHDSLATAQRTLRLPRDPSCPSCGEQRLPTLHPSYEPITCSAPAASKEPPMNKSMNALQLKEWIDRSEPHLLVDVREQKEWDLVRIPGAVLIPKGEIIDGSALERLPRDRPIVLQCKSGGRSALCQSHLVQAGFDNTINLEGGVLGWVAQVDPSLPTY